VGEEKGKNHKGGCKVKADEHVYCTKCAHFSCNENGPRCPYADKCELWDCEDSRRYELRPYYKEK
jgi:hypothetical protein